MVKKVVVADPRVSVAVETLLALPLAGGYLIVLAVLGQGHFIDYGTGHSVLLMLAGPVTAVPLLLFAAAAQRLPLITMGLLFYLNPALQMAWGVLVSHEPMPVGRWIGFAMIWVALAVMTIDGLREETRGSDRGRCRSGRTRIVITVTGSTKTSGTDHEDEDESCVTACSCTIRRDLRSV